MSATHPLYMGWSDVVELSMKRAAMTEISCINTLKSSFFALSPAHIYTLSSKLVFSLLFFSLIVFSFICPEGTNYLAAKMKKSLK